MVLSSLYHWGFYEDIQYHEFTLSFHDHFPFQTTLYLSGGCQVCGKLGGYKNKHQKDTCLKEFEQHAQNLT